MKYIKSYSDNSEYEAAKTSADFLTPNVGYIEDTKEVKYLNSKRDLYNIYGTMNGANLQSTLKINNTYKTITSDNNKEFGLVFTGSVTSFSMYSNQNYIKSFDKIDIDTSQMTSMGSMFKGCGGINKLDLSNFNTSLVSNMYTMFYQCSSLKSLNISNWDMSNVASHDFMFDNCFGNGSTITMNNTNQTTFDMIKAQLVTDYRASYVTIIRNGHSYTYNGSEWVEA